MSEDANTTSVTGISLPAARLAIAFTIAALLLLASLHILSPEFDPAWRMVSEYANGQYGWVLSLMFFVWGLGTWFLAYAIWSQVKTTGGRIGLFFLIVAGIGEAMAAVFDINHSLHGLASLIGVPSLSIAAMLISASLGRTEPWSDARKALLWTANLTWVSILLMAATFAIMISTYLQAGGDMITESTAVTALPPGVIALVGWANRFLVVAYCAWVIATARQAIRVSGREANSITNSHMKEVPNG